MRQKTTLTTTASSVFFGSFENANGATRRCLVGVNIWGGGGLFCCCENERLPRREARFMAICSGGGVLKSDYGIPLLEDFLGKSRLFPRIVSPCLLYQNVLLVVASLL